MFDRQSESGNPSPSLAPAEELDDFSQIEDTFHFGLGDGVAKRAGRLGSGDVEQGASETGALNPIDLYSVCRSESAVPMSSDPLRRPSTSVGRNNVNPTARVIENAVEIGGRTMGQDRTRSASKHRCHQVTFLVEQ